MSNVVGALRNDPQSSRDQQIPGHGFCEIDGQNFYRIAHVDALPPFFMNVVSSGDLWMFVSSRSGMTAGRVDADGALWPYDTVDRIHYAHQHSGPLTAVWIDVGDQPPTYWQPFADLRPGEPPVSRHLYKHLVGHQVVFEEIHPDTQLKFQARLATANKLGIVRTVRISNPSDQAVTLSILDGFRNQLPYGIPSETYQVASCLTDAYKRSECDLTTGLGIFGVTAGISDGTQPVEVLRANVAWALGAASDLVTMSGQSLQLFQQRRKVVRQKLSKGQRGDYFLYRPKIMIPAGGSIVWHLVADAGLSPIRIVELQRRLVQRQIDSAFIEAAIQAGTDELVKNVASADGLQQTGDQVASVHHFANVLFNNMRGGVFVDNHNLPTHLLVEFVQGRNAGVRQRHDDLWKSLPDRTELATLLQAVEQTQDVDLVRLVMEYLPIGFSRRHGDPSRPWNKFSIRTKDEAGNPLLRYEGNWRDIFQNWEALSVSFPGFLESIVVKFLNGTTVDGFNPYRVTTEGMEWEQLDPDDPWSNIGYWGDHQINYLLKLLEALQDRQPGRLKSLLTSARFVYLNVPYRIKPFHDLVENGRDTIVYDTQLARQIEQRVAERGEDGKLVMDANDEIVHVTLSEKLLVPLLSKLSNFVLGGGIWLNTQRPEWNDANNALVGHGASVVTLCYLRRYLEFCVRLFSSLDETSIPVSPAVADWARAIHEALQNHIHLCPDQASFTNNHENGAPGEAAGSAAKPHARETTTSPWSDEVRFSFLQQVGTAFCDYRCRAYGAGVAGNAAAPLNDILQLFQMALRFVDDTIQGSVRADGMFHAYNLIEFSEDGTRLAVRHLYEMLEGQVAVLSSGTLIAEQAADLLDALFLSRMYREDQHSFMLYPERQLVGFLDRNAIPEKSLERDGLLTELLAANEASIVSRDLAGTCRFQADIQKSSDLLDRLDELADNERWRPLVEQDRQSIVELFQNVFQHHSYTGRSGTMYGYEGLGCIYWHMVSKLLLAVQETYQSALDQGASPETIERLANHYRRVRDGLGPAKSPEAFGAFPTDPYSHTPSHAGAKQPGMTGQVKEEILTRMGELGVRCRAGKLEFRPTLLSRSEFCRESSRFKYVDQSGCPQELSLPESGLAFTYCQVPVIYRLADRPQVVVHWSSGTTTEFENCLDQSTSAAVFDRRGTIAKIEVDVTLS